MNNLQSYIIAKEEIHFFSVGNCKQQCVAKERWKNIKDIRLNLKVALHLQLRILRLIAKQVSFQRSTKIANYIKFYVMTDVARKWSTVIWSFGACSLFGMPEMMVTSVIVGMMHIT